MLVAEKCRLPAMRRVVVIGSTGFIGKSVYRALRDANVSVIGVSRGSGADQRIDACCEAELTRAFETANCVVNLAFMRDQSDQRNLEAVRTIVRSCKSAGVDRLVHCSSADVAGRARDDVVDESTVCAPKTRYGILKLALESEATAFLEFGDVVILRPTATFGPGGYMLSGLCNDIVHRCRTRNTLRAVAFGNRSMNLVAVENVVAAVSFVSLFHEQFNGSAYFVSDDDVPENEFATVYAVLQEATIGLKPRRTWVKSPSWALELALRILGRNCVNPMVRYSGRRLLDTGCPRPRNFLDAVRDYGRWYSQAIRQSQA